MLGLFLPISATFLAVGVIHIVNKMGYELHWFFMEPVFQSWLIIAGLIVGMCFFMRQFFLMLFLLLGSFGLMVAYFLWYLL